MELAELVKKVLPGAYSYSEYRTLIDNLYKAGKATGKDQSEKMLGYTRLNMSRMNKWDKHASISDQVKDIMSQIDQSEIWLVITEGWCGDAAHAVPVIEKMARLSDKIELKFVLRDDEPELMDQFLTDGTRSIPKLIRFNAADFTVISTWGPRPEFAQSAFLEGKERGEDVGELKKQMQLWYAKDKGQSIINEIASQIALVAS